MLKENQNVRSEIQRVQCSVMSDRAPPAMNGLY